MAFLIFLKVVFLRIYNSFRTFFKTFYTFEGYLKLSYWIYHSQTSYHKRIMKLYCYSMRLLFILTIKLLNEVCLACLYSYEDYEMNILKYEFILFIKKSVLLGMACELMLLHCFHSFHWIIIEPFKHFHTELILQMRLCKIPFSLHEICDIFRL